MNKENKNYHSDWKKEEKRSFKGWDFSYIQKRINEEIPPWNYKKEVEKLIKKSKFLLDVGTGGGEFLLSLKSLPKNTFATEGWVPNVFIAKKNLASSNVKVFGTDNNKKLPFNSDEFDLVVNRHSPYNEKEIYRVLQPGKIFITQQVGSDNLKDLVKRFNPKQKERDWTFQKAKDNLKKSGLKIETAKKWSGKTEFKDIGALVYFLKSIPWIVEDFGVDKYSSVLEKLQTKLDKKEKIIFTIRRFLITARK